jgi:hypothetical protein
MTTSRSLFVLIGSLALMSACASRAPLPGPDPVAVRTSIAAQIAQSAPAIAEDTVMR